MAKFPVDAPKRRVLKALMRLGFRLVRQREHVSMVRANADGTQTPLTMPNHPRIKARHHERSAPKPAFRGMTSWGAYEET
jgi:predicted RNA binding protein YcfA (HicA-like mRNA interferase family)